MRVSAAIRAHPSREDLVTELCGALDKPTEVVWDRHGDDWDTGVRAWRAHDPDADWHLVLEDDAVVCRDLLTGLERMLDLVPDESVVSLYLGDNPTWKTEMTRRAGATGTALVPMRALVWGVAIAAPTATITDMLDWCEADHTSPYDHRIGRYYERRLGWPAYYTWPSLVDHRQVPSLLGHRGGRRAVRFIGADASALDLHEPECVGRGSR